MIRKSRAVWSRSGEIEMYTEKRRKITRRLVAASSDNKSVITKSPWKFQQIVQAVFLWRTQKKYVSCVILHDTFCFDLMATLRQAIAIIVRDFSLKTFDHLFTHLITFFSFFLSLINSSRFANPSKLKWLSLHFLWPLLSNFQFQLISVMLFMLDEHFSLCSKWYVERLWAIIHKGKIASGPSDAKEDDEMVFWTSWRFWRTIKF